MSLFDYKQSLVLGVGDPSFGALVMAAMRKADSRNSEALRKAFPELWDELAQRYDAPGGVLDEDEAYEAYCQAAIDKWRKNYYVSKN